MFQPSYDNIFVDKRIAVTPQNTLLESRINSKEEIKKILSVSVNPEIVSSELLAGEALLTGRAVIRLLAATENGDVIGFTANADFTEKVKGDITPASKLFWDIIPLETNFEILNGVAKVSALLEISGEGVLPEETQILIGGEDILTLGKDIEFSRMVMCDRIPTVIENDLEVKQNISRILLAESFLTVKDFAVADNILTFSGKATTNVIFISDENQILFKILSFDYTQEVPINGFNEANALSLRLRTKNTKIHMDVVEDLPTTSFTVEIEAVALLCGYESEMKTVTADAYSMTHETTLNTKQIKSSTPIGLFYGETETTANVPMEGMVDKFIAVSGIGANVVKIVNGEGFADIEGVVNGDILFEKDEQTDSTRFVIPFTYTLKDEIISTDTPLSVAVTVADISYRLDRQDAEITAKLNLSVEGKRENTYTAISTIEEGAELNRAEGAIEVVLAHKGDTIWDVAKWLHMKQEDILAVNPDLAAPLEADAKIVLYHKL
ncbi:MAG TPA: hypothetical protein PK675_02130 [Clostridia bacterium]|nr:hypothetical protein [Clostridia bacterium]